MVSGKVEGQGGRNGGGIEGGKEIEQRGEGEERRGRHVKLLKGRRQREGGRRLEQKGDCSGKME